MKLLEGAPPHCVRCITRYLKQRYGATIHPDQIAHMMRAHAVINPEANVKTRDVCSNCEVPKKCD